MKYYLDFSNHVNYILSSNISDYASETIKGVAKLMQETNQVKFEAQLSKNKKFFLIKGATFWIHYNFTFMRILKTKNNFHIYYE